MLFLAYAGCSTCKKAKAWLAAHGVSVDERPIVEQPPSKAELAAWIALAGVPLKRWLNTSGQSYRALGKAKVDAMSDAQIIDALSKDGKLVRRPVLVAPKRVLVGFDEDAYAELFAKRYSAHRLR